MDKKWQWNAEECLVTIQAGSVLLEGDLVIPEAATGIIVFVHGSCCRQSTRNRFLAHVLRQKGFATLLVNLLTPDEEVIDARTRYFRSHVSLLAERLVGTTIWLTEHAATSDLKIGYFGAGPGADAALTAAAHSRAVGAVVCRGGELELNSSLLAQVQAPTLLIVGEQDLPGTCSNQDALAYIQTEKQLVLVPGASHLFQEQGALEEAALLASQWFKQHLQSPHSATPLRSRPSNAYRADPTTTNRRF